MAETEDDKKAPETDADKAAEPADAEGGESGGGDWRSQLESHLADAKVLGNEIKDKLSGAGKKASDEAKDTWKMLEPQLENAEKTLKEAADGAVESLQGMFGDLKGQLGKLRDKL
ncbi:MAG: hypothetical protein AAF721_13860 [Myxococcota bacterium]